MKARDVSRDATFGENPQAVFDVLDAAIDELDQQLVDEGVEALQRGETKLKVVMIALEELKTGRRMPLLTYYELEEAAAATFQAVLRNAEKRVGWRARLFECWISAPTQDEVP